MCTFLDGGGGLRKCVLYTQINVDNYEQGFVFFQQFNITVKEGRVQVGGGWVVGEGQKFLQTQMLTLLSISMVIGIFIQREMLILLSIRIVKSHVYYYHFDNQF